MKLDELSFGDGIPAKYTTFELDPGRGVIQIEAVSEYNENGVGVGYKRVVRTHIIYAQHAKEISKWFEKAAKIMDSKK